MKKVLSMICMGAAVLALTACGNSGGRAQAPETTTEGASGETAQTMQVDIDPAEYVELGEYKGLTVEKTPVEVSDEEVEEQLELLAQDYAEYREITERDSGTKHILIDGGVVANNPALIAYEEARKLYPDASEFRILSLSTCAPRYVFDPSDGPGGITGWANPIIKVYSGAQMSLVDEIMPSIKGVEYARIWAPVLEKRIKLDATTDESVQTLLDAAERTYDATERTLRSFAYDLAEEKVHDSVRLYDDVPAMIEDSSGKGLDSL